MEPPRYVLGFLFDEEDWAVVLIEKQRPDWAHGKLNGVGGLIEPHEERNEAMTREFEEETGVYVARPYWRGFGEMIGVGWTVFLFEARAPMDTLRKTKTKTDEKVLIIPVDEAMISRKEVLVPSVSWLLLLAQDRSKLWTTIQKAKHIL